MQKPKEPRITRALGFILAPVLLVLTGNLFDLADLAWAKQKIACDFLTGAGRVHATGDGGMLGFGLAGGVKYGAFWGHLAYLDYGPMLKVESTSITNYVVRGPATRVIEGTARTNLYGDRHYRVTVTDNREPGRNETFQIELDNGYFKQGTLFTGSVVLLRGNLNSTPPAGFTCDKFSDDTPKGRAP